MAPWSRETQCTTVACWPYLSGLRAVVSSLACTAARLRFLVIQAGVINCVERHQRVDRRQPEHVQLSWAEHAQRSRDLCGMGALGRQGGSRIQNRTWSDLTDAETVVRSGETRRLT
jgi:hypothetical protein